MNSGSVSEYRSGGVRLRMIPPAPDLAPYLFGCYHTEIAPGTVIDDWLPPEEANLRAGRADLYEAAIGDGPIRPVPAVALTGPRDRCAHLRISSGKFWGIGLSPAGWARFIGTPVSDMVNRFCDIDDAQAPPEIAAMLHRLNEIDDDFSAAAEVITTVFRDLLKKPLKAEPSIRAVHLALLSEEISTVAELTERVGMKPRTFERFCARYFGFTPRVLLRRQRFLRSLGQYFLDPSMRWIGSLDGNYWDQAHFIRDFRRVMYMTPSEFARLPHPLCLAMVSVINERAGVAMQSLFHPDRTVPGETGL